MSLKVEMFSPKHKSQAVEVETGEDKAEPSCVPLLALQFNPNPKSINSIFPYCIH